MKKNIQGWIFVREESLRFSSRHKLMLNNKPLVAYAVDAARKSRYIKDVFISTDSPDIAAVAEQYGAIVPFLRPKDLAADIPVQSSWQHAVEWNRRQHEFPRMDVMVSLPVTSPLRLADDIDNAIELYLAGDCESVISVSPSSRHPAYDMVFLNDSRCASLILPNNDPFARIKEPQAYDIVNLLHVSSADFIASGENYFNHRTKAVIIPPERSIDVCSELDMRIAELILQEEKL